VNKNPKVEDESIDDENGVVIVHEEATSPVACYEEKTPPPLLIMKRERNFVQLVENERDKKNRPHLPSLLLCFLLFEQPSVSRDAKPFVEIIKDTNAGLRHLRKLQNVRPFILR
jgi:hypothetical protein